MDVRKLPTSARQSESLCMRVTGNQQRSDKLTVRLNSVVSWEVVGNQDVKKILSIVGTTPPLTSRATDQSEAIRELET